MTAVPHDASVEEMFIGGCLAWADRIPGFARELDPDDFYVPRFGALWRVMTDLAATGDPIDRITILNRLGRSDVSEADLLHYMANGLAPKSAHASIIRGHRYGRDIQRAAQGALEAIAGGVDPTLVNQALRDAQDEAQNRAVLADDLPPTMREFLAEREESPWLINGLIKRDWRVFFIAGEGAGKSVLLRMIAMMAAQGIHPFTCKPMEPLKTLIVDFENPYDAIAETGQDLDLRVEAATGHGYDPTRCRIFSQLGGFDLRKRGGLALEHAIARVRPDLVVLGPLYKASPLHPGDNHETQAEGVQAVLDELRSLYNFALMVEHHAPKGQPFSKRDMSPYGSSLWLRWPEIGIGLNIQKDESLTLSRWRGDRMANDWPSEIRRGRVWPFEGTWKHGMTSVLTANGATQNVGNLADAEIDEEAFV